MSDFEPGFYYMTTDRICGIDYVNVPDWKINKGSDLLKMQRHIKPGQTILFELGWQDEHLWRAAQDTFKRGGYEYKV